MLNKLDSEQEKMVAIVRDEWINHAMTRNGEIDKAAFENGIAFVYNELLNKPTPNVVYCSSWLSCVLTIAILKDMKNQVRAQVSDQVRDQVSDQVSDQVWAQVRDQVSDQVSAQVRAQVWAQVRAQVRDQVSDQVRAQVSDQVRDQVSDQVSAQVWAQVRAQVRDQVSDQVSAQVWAQVWAQVRAQVSDQVREIFGQRSTYISYDNYGWVAFYDLFSRIGVLSNPKFDKYLPLIKSGVFECYEYENVVFAIRPPVKIVRNQAGRLHNTEGSSVSFIDGSEYFFANGRAIPKRYFISIKRKSFSVEDFFKEANEETKSACIALMQELYGDEYLFTFFEQFIKEVNTYIDKKQDKYLVGTTGGMNIGVYTLFKGVVNNEEVAYVRCYCPSSDRIFFLGVDPVHKNAKDAIASLYRVPKKLKPHIKYIQRQGERFSTVFDEKGTGMLQNKSLSQQDIADTDSISGNQYFSLIKYEY